VDVTFFGTRGSCPCSGSDYSEFGGSTSCVLIEDGDDHPLILDAGTGLRTLGAWMRPELLASGRVLQATILLTHLHYDHLLGLPFFTPLLDPGAKLDLYGPTQDAGSLEEVIQAAVSPPFFPIQMREFHGDVTLHSLDEEEFGVGTMSVMSRWVPHVGPTLGYRIEAGGVVVAYLPDHQAPLDRDLITDGVMELCRDADLVIHDSQYDDDEFVGRSDWGHSTVAYAVHVAAAAGARALKLFHHDPSHDDDRLFELEAFAASLPSAHHLESVTSAREGQTILLTR